MKYQIILVGGQILPLYLGIKEFKPDYVYFVASEDSKYKTDDIIKLIPGLKHEICICNPYDFKSITDTINYTLKNKKHEDEALVNLNGGTKVMVIAAYSVMLKNNFGGFYFNNTESVLVFPSHLQTAINEKITIDEFFSLSGHKISNFQKIENITEKDKIAAEKIYKYAVNNNKDYKDFVFQIFKQFKSRDIKIQASGKIKLQNQILLLWDNNKIEIFKNGKTLEVFSSENIISIFFNSSWWEIIVAEEIFKSNKVKEIRVQVELPFKTNKKILKNEIDVLINLGRQLVFIECKSGKVKQEDINKMKIIKDTYGGIISKSLLVCFEKPNDGIIEKCNELGIEIFYNKFEKTQSNDLSQIHFSIEKLSKSSLF